MPTANVKLTARRVVAEKRATKRPVRLARARLTPDQRAARLEVLAAIRVHNPEPTREELDAVRREWLED